MHRRIMCTCTEVSAVENRPVLRKCIAITCSKEPWASFDPKKDSYIGNGVVNFYADKPVSSLSHKVEPIKRTLSSALLYLARLI